MQPANTSADVMGYLLALVILAFCVACDRSPSTTGNRDDSSPHSSRPTPQEQPPSDDIAGIGDVSGDWTRPALDLASTRFSPLDRITVESVKQLGVRATFSTGFVRGHEAAPLVANGTMFIVTPFPNVVYALDLTKPGIPAKWSYHPKTLGAAQGVVCCDVVNRGAVFDAGTIYFNTLDNRTIALDAETGKEKWVATLGDINTGQTITMAPLVAKGKVLVGNSGGEMGVRGWLTALDAATGKIAWRAYSTGPDTDVLIGPRFKPFYAHLKGTDLGIHTWPGEAWKQGGGTVWGWLSFDPVLNLVYAGTGNPGPWNAEQRPGDNHWTSGIFARDIDTGEAVWFYQTSPHDLFDYDDVNEAVLVDLRMNGQNRKVMLRPNRDGYVYVIDRASGQVLSADPFVHITSTKGIDLQRGRPVENPEKHADSILSPTSRSPAW